MGEGTKRDSQDNCSVGAKERGKRRGEEGREGGREG